MLKMDNLFGKLIESKNVAKSFSFMLEERFGFQGGNQQGSPKKLSDDEENAGELKKTKKRQDSVLNLMQAEEKNETIVLQNINLKVSFLLFNVIR